MAEGECLGMGFTWGRGQTPARVPPCQCLPSPQALSAAWCGLCPLVTRRKLGRTEVSEQC